MTVRVAGVPPGNYAVQAWHHENDNGRIDRDLLGIPTEGIGFSRNAPIRLGAPSFEDAAFTVEASGAWNALKLRYFKGGSCGFPHPGPLPKEEGAAGAVVPRQEGRYPFSARKNWSASSS